MIDDLPFLRVNEEASYGATVSGSCLVMFDSGVELRKQAATVFVQYLAGAEVQADYAANTGYIPGNKEAMEMITPRPVMIRIGFTDREVMPSKASASIFLRG